MKNKLKRVIYQGILEKVSYHRLFIKVVLFHKMILQILLNKFNQKIQNREEANER